MIERLNDRFGIDQHITFENGQNNMPKVAISNKYAKAEIYLHGAHVTAFQPHAAEPILWMSERADFQPSRAIRGGVPVIWPWFGAHPSDTKKPSHGFARTQEWAVTNSRTLPGERTKVSLRLDGSDATKEHWSHPFVLEVHVTVGLQLQVDLVTHNLHNEGVEVTQALHSYFHVGDISQVSVAGLNGKNYLDKVQEFRQYPQYGKIPFIEEVDRIYLDTSDECLIIDDALKRTIHVDKLGSHSTVVWNPWIEKSKSMSDFPDDGYKTMVCVETTNAASDKRRIPPRSEHVLTQLIRLG